MSGDLEPTAGGSFAPSETGGAPLMPESTAGAAESGPIPTRSQEGGWYGPKVEGGTEGSQGAESGPAGKDGAAAALSALLRMEDMKLPDGASLDAGASKSFLDLLNNAELASKDRGQGLLDLHGKEMARYAKQVDDNQRKVWDDLNAGWKNDLRNDKELGGKNLQTSLSRAKAVLEDNLSSADVKALLSHTDLNGMSNYPPFIRFLNNLGRRLNVYEDGVVVANPQPPRGGPGAGRRGWYD
jgi:hypothetical protein